MTGQWKQLDVAIVGGGIGKLTVNPLASSNKNRRARCCNLPPSCRP